MLRTALAFLVAVALGAQATPWGPSNAYRATGSTTSVPMQYVLDAQGFRPESFGAKADGTTDDAAAIEAASAAAVASAAAIDRAGAWVVFRPGKVYKCSRGITIKANIWGKGAELLFPNDFTGTALSLGAAGTEYIENKQFWLPSVICTRTTYTNWNATPNSVGVQMNGTRYCEVHVDVIRNFAKGLRLYASGGYFVGYNSVYFGLMQDNKEQLVIENGDTNAQSWINENRFYNGRMTQSANFGTNVPGAKSVRIKQFATAGAVTTTQTLSIVQATGVITWSGGDFTAAGFYVGANVTMSGWANAASNITARVSAVGTTTMTIASNVTLGANETNKAGVTIATEAAPFGSIPNNNNFYGVSMESDVAECMVEIRGGMLNNFFGCRYERTAGTAMFMFGMDSSNAPCQKNNFYGGYTNGGTDLTLTTNTWATQNSAVMANRMALSSISTYGPIQTMNAADITKPVMTIWSVNNVGDSTVFKPTGTTWLSQYGGYFLDMKPAASAQPKLRIGGSPGEIYLGDGTTALGPKLQVFGANTGFEMASGWLVFPGTTGNTLRVTTPVANASVAVTLGSTGPTGSTAGAPQGWMRVNINGTDRYIPFW